MKNRPYTATCYKTLVARDVEITKDFEHLSDARLFAYNSLKEHQLIHIHRDGKELLERWSHKSYYNIEETK